VFFHSVVAFWILSVLFALISYGLQRPRCPAPRNNGNCPYCPITGGPANSVSILSASQTAGPRSRRHSGWVPAAHVVSSLLHARYLFDVGWSRRRRRRRSSDQRRTGSQINHRRMDAVVGVESSRSDIVQWCWDPVSQSASASKQNCNAVDSPRSLVSTQTNATAANDILPLPVTVVKRPYYWGNRRYFGMFLFLIIYSFIYLLGWLFFI